MEVDQVILEIEVKVVISFKSTVSMARMLIHAIPQHLGNQGKRITNLNASDPHLL